MKIYHDLAEISDLVASAVTVGNFDGIHRGHQRLIEVLCATAKRLGVPSVVMTFHPHPAAVINPEKAPLPLSWLEKKLTLLSQSGVDAVVIYPTTPTLLAMAPESFFYQVLVHRLKAQAIVEGEDFRFGHGRSGDIALLRDLCARERILCITVPPVIYEGEPVSSSRVRQAVLEGRVDYAAELLARPFRSCGRVVRGAGRGSQLGFPTANLGEVKTILPKEGIYAGAVPLGGRMYPAAISLGGNPTFAESQPKFEVYIIDFAGNLYGQWLEVDFVGYLREIRKYDSVEALIEQMNRDVAAARAAFQQFAARYYAPLIS